MKFYLEQLICALNEDDINLLSQMDLKKSKIKTYLGILIENRKVGIPDKELVMDKLDVDENAFRKMRSVILNRCLKELVPEGGTALLHFLSRYRLHEIFWREADEIITKMKKDKSISKDDKAKIYLQSIRGYMRLPFSLFSSAKLESYVKGFSANYTKKDKQDILDVIRLNELFILIVHSFFRMDTSESNHEYFFKEVKLVEERAISAANKKLMLFSRGVGLVLDFYYKEKWSALQHDFEELRKEYTVLNDPAIADELLAIRFYQAYNQIMLNNYEEANKLFDSLRSDYKAVYNYFPHLVLRNASSLIMTGRNNECKNLIDSSLNKNVLVYDADATIMSCVTYTAYYLLENDVDKALEYINLYQTVRNKRDLFSFEIPMRLFEIVYFFQRGDALFAASQLKKFTRYLDDKSDLVGTAKVAPLIKRLSVVFNDLVTDKISLKKLQEELKNLFHANQTVLSLLLLNAAKIRVEGWAKKSTAQRVA